MRIRPALLLIFGCILPVANAQPARPDIGGVYLLADGVHLLAGGVHQLAGGAAGHKGEGAPAQIQLLPAAAQAARAINLKDDPAKMCQPVGPFRMMAREGNKIEVIPANGLIVMLFEDAAHGFFRNIFLNRTEHLKGAEPTWMGDSIGRWEGDTLVVDTTNFNDRTWLNEKGAQHSEALHLVERIRPVGKYLEYKVTADDPKSLAKPYTYTRYYEKVNSEIKEDVCEDEE